MRSAEKPRCLVLLGANWSVLETHNTRWSAVIREWIDADLVQVSVVDFPRFTIRRAGTEARWRELESWLPGVRSGVISVPARRRMALPTDRFAWAWVGRQISRALQQLDLVVAATPLWAPVLQHIRAGRRGFDAVDDWRDLDLVADLKMRVLDGYAALRTVDSITANSDITAERLPAFGAPISVVRNGVDLRQFQSTALPRPAGVPDGKYAVYVGVIQERIDVDLLRHVATTVDIPVVVAGGGDESILMELRRAGVVTLGRIDHSLVPGLLKSAAVGLIPHRVIPLTESMDPLKLLEYLAAGLPVVSTPLPGVDISERVKVAATPADFASAVSDAVARGTFGDIQDAALRDRDWSRQARGILEAHLPEIY